MIPAVTCAPWKPVSTKNEIAGLYWHFVDVVWIVIFTVVYLVPQPGK